MKADKMNIFDELYELPFAENVTMLFGGDEPLVIIKTTDYGTIEFPTEMIEDKSYIGYYNSVISKRANTMREYYDGISSSFKHPKT